jgi:hypothetical protein
VATKWVLRVGESQFVKGIRWVEVFILEVFLVSCCD